jgi:hypothetical protein
MVPSRRDVLHENLLNHCFYSNISELVHLSEFIGVLPALGVLAFSGGDNGSGATLEYICQRPRFHCLCSSCAQ